MKKTSKCKKKSQNTGNNTSNKEKKKQNSRKNRETGGPNITSSREDKICLFRDEAKRISSLLIEVLTDLQETKKIDLNIDDNNETLSRKKLEKEISILSDELEKLEKLELVLTIVGTMKAGKSTTINAIVGTEIMPNRNRPMTTIPTLIRHSEKQIQPKLIFQKVEPVNTLIKRLKAAISRKGKKANKNEELSFLETLKWIESGGQFDKKPVVGNEDIFDCLEKLNDISRLASEFSKKTDEPDLVFPFEEYQTIDNLPVIEVEFAPLKGVFNNAGTLTLMDTPGPNEAGQRALRLMLKEQLRRSSAILAVLDYTQLKSDADDELRNEILAIQNMCKGRNFVIVNKFDEKDRNSDNEKETKNFVSSQLFNSEIYEDSIFPVSAKLAYLSRRATQEVVQNGGILEENFSAWVEDFGKEAFGRCWETIIGEKEKVLEHADILWKESNFEEPLEKIIRRAHATAGIKSIESAIAKSMSCTNQLKNFLNTRKTALKIDIDKLKDSINELNDQIKSLKQLADNSKKKVNKIINRFNDFCCSTINSARQDLGYGIERWFKHGKTIEKKAAQKAERKAREQDFNSIDQVMGFFFGEERPSREKDLKHDLNLSIDVIKFRDHSDFEMWWEKTADEFNSLKRVFESATAEKLDTALKTIKTEIDESIIKEVQSFIGTISAKLSKRGFNIELRTPEISQFYLEFSGKEILRDAIEIQRETVKRKRRQTGTWGKICEWFDSEDWGWEEYEDIVENYQISQNKLYRELLTNIEQAFESLNEQIAKLVQDPLNEEIEGFFEKLEKNVNSLAADLKSGINDKSKTEDEQKQIFNYLDQNENNVTNMTSDLQGLSLDLEKYSAR
mgnify:CR=1 FL=1